jgi:hypothetical protein
LLQEWDEKADVIGLGSIQFPFTIGEKRHAEAQTETHCQLGGKL